VCAWPNTVYNRAADSARPQTVTKAYLRKAGAQRSQWIVAIIDLESGWIVAIIDLERGIPNKLKSSAWADYVPALCTHRPSLLPIEWPGELPCLMHLPCWGIIQNAL